MLGRRSGDRSFVMPRACPVCHSEGPLGNDENCSTCEARPRTRSMVPLLERVVGPLVILPEKPLLAFAMTGREQKLLSVVFPRFASVSLYGRYGHHHQEGVDVRDLRRYGAGGMSGVFGCLLFDYFVEHELALQQAASVISDGGVFITHIASHRLTDDMRPARLVGTVERADGYRSYYPPEGLPSISVGRQWFVTALERAGFDAMSVRFSDRGDGPALDWFVGVKRGARRFGPVAKALQT